MKHITSILNGFLKDQPKANKIGCAVILAVLALPVILILLPLIIWKTITFLTYIKVDEEPCKQDYVKRAEWLREKVIVAPATDVSGMSMKITTDANPEGWVISQEDFVYDSENNYYYVDFGELHAGQMRQCIYATVYSGNTAVSHTLRYSIESYAASFAANTDYPTVADLVKAMMRYGDAAYNFVN